MNDKSEGISLGFTPQEFPPGIHVCQIISDDSEAEEAVLQFLLSGLRAGERASCFSERVSQTRMAGFFRDHGLLWDEAARSGALTLKPPQEVYFANNRFDSERMLGALAQYHEESVSQGFAAARVIGEMPPEVQGLEGSDSLLEYECKVSLLLRTHPVTAVCQYDARGFGGAVIMDVLKVHPFMVVRGSLVQNPFFIPPEEFLAR